VTLQTLIVCRVCFAQYIHGKEKVKQAAALVGGWRVGGQLAAGDRVRPLACWYAGWCGWCHKKF